MDISANAEKIADKTPHTYMIRNIQKKKKKRQPPPKKKKTTLGVEVNYLSIIKTI